MSDILTNIQQYWYWIAAACLFLAAEVLIVPSGFFLCLGTSAGIVGAVTFVFPDLSWLWSMVIFSVCLVVSGLIWWKLIKGRALSGATDDEALNRKVHQLVGFTGVLTQDMQAGRGRLRVNDSDWPIEAKHNYPAGSTVRVTDVKGITLVVTGDDKQDE